MPRWKKEEPESSSDLSMAWIYLYQREEDLDGAVRFLFAIGDDPDYIERRIWTAGRLKGEQLTLRANILALLKHHFGTMGAAEVAPMIEALTETSDLKPLFELAVRCERLEVFAAACKESYDRLPAEDRKKRAQR
jgi:hypothetical protein